MRLAWFVLSLFVLLPAPSFSGPLARDISTALDLRGSAAIALQRRRLLACAEKMANAERPLRRIRKRYGKFIKHCSLKEGIDRTF